MKLKVEHLSLAFDSRPVLNDISFDVHDREFVSILGPSGCGKSTILNILAGVLEGYEKAYPSALSGGMRQRAAFLRTSLCDADILLLDEPFGALDVITRNEMQDWLLGLRERYERTTLLVTHDIDEALYLSDRIVILSARPSRILKEIDLRKKEKSRDWLFAQSRLKKDIYDLLKGENHA